MFKTIRALLIVMLAISVGLPARSTAQNVAKSKRVILPLIQCWYKGKVAYYISTEVSDKALAKQTRVTYVPQLAGVGQQAIYHVTNFQQGNVIPSAPIPEGPGNKDQNYSPLWQVVLVTWNQGKQPHVLKSEEAIKKAQTDGLVTIMGTNIVVNCPVIYTPFGGLFPGAKIINGVNE